VPKNSVFYGALMCNGQTVTGCGIPDCPKDLDDEHIRLLHCRYKGKSDWIRKYGGDGAVTVSDAIPRKKDFSFIKLN
jgi:hypothetical protein